ncbi:MAG: tetratricopeptide repeat protein, partial [Pseudomonadota bacterium]
ATAEKELRAVENMKKLTPYETAQLYNFYAFIRYSNEDYPGAARAYEKVLEQPDLPEGMATATRYSLAQLYFVQEDYSRAEGMLEDWFALVTNPNPRAYVMLSQCRYSMDKYREALEPLSTAIQLAETGEEGKAEENWYSLQRVLYYELEDYENTAKVLEKLIRLYPRKDYWMQLAGMFGELDDQAKQLVVLDLAYKQGFFSRGPEYTNLAQLLIQDEIPYRAAQVLEDGIEKGHVKRNVNNLRLLSQAYVVAAEDEKAIDPLRAAAKLDDDGELYMHLANSLFNLDRFDESAEAAREAIDRGLKKESEARITLGMALYELDKLEDSRKEFLKIKNNKMASQWVNFIEKEQARLKQLADAIAANRRAAQAP